MIGWQEALERGLVHTPDGQATPSEIPDEWKLLAVIGKNLFQIIDRRCCYNGVPGVGMIQCNNVGAHAHEISFPPDRSGYFAGLSNDWIDRFG